MTEFELACHVAESRAINHRDSFGVFERADGGYDVYLAEESHPRQIVVYHPYYHHDVAAKASALKALAISLAVWTIFSCTLLATCYGKAV